MPHPFYRIASNVLRLPNRFGSSVWERLRKCAHPIWDVNVNSGQPVPIRKADEDVELNDVQVEQPGSAAFNSGDYIVLLLGGRYLKAKILADNADGLLIITSDGSIMSGISKSWVKSAQSWKGKDTGQWTEEEWADYKRWMEEQKARPMMTQMGTDLRKFLVSKGGSYKFWIKKDKHDPILGDFTLNQDGSVGVVLYHLDYNPMLSKVYRSTDEVAAELHLEPTIFAD